MSHATDFRCLPRRSIGAATIWQLPEAFTHLASPQIIGAEVSARPTSRPRGMSVRRDSVSAGCQ